MPLPAGATIQAVAVRAFHVAAALLVALFLLRELTATPAVAVGVRWQPEVASAGRRDAESRYLLANGVTRTADNSTYDLLDLSAGNIRALVEDPRIADTQGADRSAFEPTGDPSNETITSALARLPGIHNPGTRSVFLFLLLIVAAPGAAMALVRRLRLEQGVDRAGRRTVVWTLATVAIFVALARFLTLGDRLLGDDHFGLWAAAAFLKGGVPYRDFFDVGTPLYWGTSVLGQLLTGYRALGEVLAGTILLTIGFVLSFFLTWRASRSLWIAVMTLIVGVILLLPTKLYSYPKLFIYPVMLALLWRYIAQPSMRRLVAVAAAMAMALLFRHDHGLFVAPAVATAIILAAGGQVGTSIKRLAAFAACLMILLAPWLLWVAATEGLLEYFPARLQQSVGAGLLEERPSIGLVPSEGTGAPPLPLATVTVLWRDEQSATRNAAAQRFSLSSPTPADDGQVQYVLGDTSIANIRALIADPAVAGVTGVDAVIGMPSADQGLFAHWRRRLPWADPQRLPAFLTEPRNAGQWLFSSFMLLPFAALALIVVDTLRRRPERFPNERKLVSVSAVLAATAALGLMREMGRFCDITTVMAVTAGWMLSRTLVHPVSTRVAAFAGTLALAVLATTAVAASAFADLPSHARGRYFGEALSIYGEQAAHQLSAFSTSPPIDSYAPADSQDDRLLIRYFRECTEPADAIWGVTQGFAWPYYAERQLVLHPEWAAGFKRTPADQEYALAWVKAHGVPIIFSIDADPIQALEAYPLVHAYVTSRFVNASTPAFQQMFADERRTGWIYVDAQRPVVKRDPVLGLPCFR